MDFPASHVKFEGRGKGRILTKKNIMGPGSSETSRFNGELNLGCPAEGLIGYLEVEIVYFEDLKTAR